jgi:uncharacterized membrane protein
MRALVTTLAAALALAACSKSGSQPARASGPPAEAEPSAVTAPASAPAVGGVDLSSDLKLTGPQWSLDVGPDQLKLVRPGKPDVTAKNSGPVVSGDSAVWTATDANGAPLRITLAPGRCLDPGGVALPLVATVLAGGDTLKGCGIGELVKADDHATAPSGPPVDVE